MSRKITAKSVTKYFAHLNDKQSKTIKRIRHKEIKLKCVRVTSYDLIIDDVELTKIAV